MKKLYTLIALAACVSFASCSSEEAEDALIAGEEVTEDTPVFYSTAEPDPTLFPTADSSVELVKQPSLSDALSRCVRKADESLGAELNEGMATQEQIEVLQPEVEVIIENATTDKEKLDAIYDWVRTNIKYDHNGEVFDQSAYSTFINQKAVCQGYSNLMNVMCHIAGLQCFNVNGHYTSNWLGHAWNYVKAGNYWYVVDATNNQMYTMTSTTAYRNDYYPSMIDVTLFEDENFEYTWYGNNLAVTRVKQGNTQLTVPFSINGLRISSFNPLTDIPSNVKVVYLGSNIVHLGDYNDVGVNNHGPSVEAIHVHPDNGTFVSEKGIVYRRNGDEVQLNVIPAAMRWVELSSKLTMLEKNAIYNNNSIETLVIPSSVNAIEQWAVEGAPNLKWIYIPENCIFYGVDSNYNTVEYTEPTANTFVGVHKDCQIIRGEVPTSIKRITL